MWTYVIAHWRGQQSLTRSVFLNGRLGYVIWTALAGLGIVLEGAGRGPEVLAFTFLAAMLLWLLWSLVGIVRCGVRILVDHHSRIWRKLGAIFAIGGSLAFAGVAGHDLIDLVSAKAWYRVGAANPPLWRPLARASRPATLQCARRSTAGGERSS